MKRIIFFIYNKENERLLVNELKSNYEILIGSSRKDIELSFDLLIIDGISLEKMQKEIMLRRYEEKPLFLPVLRGFMSEMGLLGVEQIFTSYDNPKGNRDTERVMRTIKEELIWLNEFSSIEEARERIGRWIEEEYNRRYVHSSLGYLSPEEYKLKYYREQLINIV